MEVIKTELYDPRKENKDLAEQVKERLRDIGYPFEIIERNEMLMIKFDLPKGEMSISLKQAVKKPVSFIKELIEAAMNQDEIKSRLPKPSVKRESDLE